MGRNDERYERGYWEQVQMKEEAAEEAARVAAMSPEERAKHDAKIKEWDDYLAARDAEQDAAQAKQGARMRNRQAKKSHSGVVEGADGWVHVVRK